MYNIIHISFECEKNSEDIFGLFSVAYLVYITVNLSSDFKCEIRNTNI